MQEWESPGVGWLRCDIGTEWCKHTLVNGVSWILRNEKGEVLMNSRGSFSNVPNATKAQANGWLWAIENMRNLRKTNIVFGVESSELLGAVLRPPAWPSFKWISLNISSSLHFLDPWKLKLTKRKANLPTFLIAKSAISKNFSQSYVASGHPRWFSGSLLFFVQGANRLFRLLLGYN